MIPLIINSHDKTNDNKFIANFSSRGYLCWSIVSLNVWFYFGHHTSRNFQVDTLKPSKSVLNNSEIKLKDFEGLAKTRKSVKTQNLDENKQFSEFSVSANPSLHKEDLGQFTPPNNFSILIYNRVPKCGSTTLHNAFAKLKKRQPKLQSIHIRSYVRPREKHYFKENTGDLYNFQTMTENSALQKLIYIRHFYYISAETSKSKEKFKYINMVRDPVEHFISWYYWERHHQQDDDWRHVVEEGTEELSIDECIRQKFKSCIHPGDYTEYLNYFCGQDKFCYERLPKNDGNVMIQAKRNVENQYILVGVLEESELSVRILEKLLPGWFRGLRGAYNSVLNEKGKSNIGHNKQNVSDSAREFLKSKLGFEIQFYDWVSRRLQKQALDLRIEDEINEINPFMMG